MYSQPIGDIIKKHSLSYHSYADDTQIYGTFKPTDMNFKIAADDIQNCISKVVSWMEQNFLKLNKDKTELIVFTSKHRQDLCNTLNIKIGNNLTVPKPYVKVKNLGVTLDTALSMESHVRTVSKTCRYHLRNISRIRHVLSEDACRTIIQALVTSRLDYANALLYGLPEKITSHLQRVQNMAARIIIRTSKGDHIKPVLKQLHWMPVKQRIEYKVLIYILLKYCLVNPQVTSSR